MVIIMFVLPTQEEKQATREDRRNITELACLEKEEEKNLVLLELDWARQGSRRWSASRVKLG